MVVYDNPRLQNFDMARRNGRILIDGGLYTPIREGGLVVAVEPTEALLSLFDNPAPEEQVFDVLLEFVDYHQWGTPRVTEICDRLIALGMRRGESLTLYKAVRRGYCVPA